MVAREADKMRETFMLVRGDYDKKGDKVPPGCRRFSRRSRPTRRRTGSGSRCG